MTTTVSNLLEGKGRDVWSVNADTSTFDALQIMAQKGIGALVVMDGNRLIGVVTERDYARKVILQDRSSKDTPIRDIMTTEVLCARPEHSVDECMALMTDKDIRHLPVVDGGRVLGMLSIRDLVKAAIAEKQFIIEQLEHYITR